jgi:transcriptional regulator with XRE-family HTH domain
VTTAAISKLERGRSRPRVLTALRITHALGRSLDDLLTAIAPANDPRRPDGSIADCGFCRESRSSFEAIAAAGPNPETVRWLGHDGAWEMAQSIANKYRGQSVCSTVHWVADLIEGRVAA